MGTGSILQLMATGIKDIYFTAHPEMNIFQYKYYRYVNFANDLYNLHLNDTASFGSQTYIKIPHYGHLLSKMYLHIKLPPLVPTSGKFASWSDSLGYCIFSKPIELQISGIVVDRIWPVAADMLYELTTPSGTKAGLDKMLCRGDMYRSSLYNANQTLDLFIPLDFWFTKKYVMPLPLLSMTSQDIQLNFYFNNFSDVINYDGVTPPNEVSILESSLYCEYIFLDDIILKQFQKQKHQYVIQQVIYNGDEIIPAGKNLFNTRIVFQNPCQEILFACVDSLNYDTNNYFNYSSTITNGPLISEIALFLDGTHRYDHYLPEFIFRDFFPNNVHSIIPSKHMYTMPFAIKPEDIGQPTGSIDLGRFDEVILSLKMNQGNNDCRLYVFGICYNIVCIQDGMLFFEFMTQ